MEVGMLCDVCTRMFSSGDVWGYHHTSLVSFTSAAEDGCYICTPLLKYARRKTEQLAGCLTAKYEYVFSDFQKSSDQPSFAIMMSMEKNGKHYSDVREYYAAQTSLLPVGNAIHDRMTAIPIPTSLQAAQKWMSHCLNEHKQCQKLTEPHIYPTRLLELGAHKSRLIISREDQPSGPYAALSYCWGPDASFIRLTAESLRDFRLCLPYSKLPIAFQEAICFIQGLGIRYLWIDALCIIQSGSGSSQDWQSECGRMQEVYSNCMINLSLSQAAHPNQSCLGGYDFGSTPPFEANIVQASHDHGPMEAHTYTILSYDYFKEALYKQPIGGRAWVMQERLLATRVLSIGHGELFWDCHELPHASESLPYGFTLYSPFLRDYFSRIIGLSIHSIPQTSDGGGLEEIWSKILMEYTTRELTYPQVDKLVALSAISTRMGCAMNDTYLAGHFRKSLPRSLNWKALRKGRFSSIAYEEDSVPRRLAKSSSQMLGGSWVVTPSWSWASMDGRLHMWVTHESDETHLGATEAYELLPINVEGAEGHVENKLLLTIRTWCETSEWKRFQPSINRTHKVLLELEKEEEIFVVMDDINDQPSDRSVCVLAALSHSTVVKGLLLKETDLNGSKAYERFGHFIHFLSKADGTTRDWNELFTHGERSITLC